MAPYKVALIGNPNCGKTTIFNQLTGLHQRVGNFPGVTVTKKVGINPSYPQIEIVDLPGLYSITPTSLDEQVVTSYLDKEPPNVIVNIVDATNLERSLYLTMQLLEWNIPMVLVCNMMDQLPLQNIALDTDVLAAELQIPVIPVRGHYHEEVMCIMPHILTAITRLHKPKVRYPKIQSIIDLDTDTLRSTFVSQHDLLIQLQDVNISDRNPLLTKLLDKKTKIESIMQMPIDEALIVLRYQQIDDILCKVLHRPTDFKQTEHTLDTLLMHRYLGVPIFLTIMLTIFMISFHWVGPPLQDLLSVMMEHIQNGLHSLLLYFKVAPWLISLLLDGILSGVSNVLSFLPIVLLLFFFLTILEDTGYMARIAYIMDTWLERIGLSGKAFIPMLLAMGCSVPAIMATRTLSNRRERLVTIIIIPFISCSAKLPIYGMIIQTFFPSKTAFILLFVYLMGIFLAILCAFIFSLFQATKDVGFVMELPIYRLPSPRNISLQLVEKGKDFITKVFTIIVLASLVLWVLQSFTMNGNYTIDTNSSILSNIGHTITWLLHPLGIFDWQLTTAIATGIIAKESVVSTLSVLLNANTMEQLQQSLSMLLTPVSALSFLTFTILYMPCIAAFATIRKELHSLKKAIIIVTFQTVIAYIIAIIVYNVGILLC